MVNDRWDGGSWDEMVDEMRYGRLWDGRWDKRKREREKNNK